MFMKRFDEIDSLLKEKDQQLTIEKDKNSQLEKQ